MFYGLKISENIEIKHVFQSKAFFHFSNNLHTSCLRAFKLISWPNFMEGYYNLSPDIWGKIFTDWFSKCYDGYIVSILYEFIHFLLPLNPEIHRMDNSPSTLCLRIREQDESHPHFIFHCNPSKTTLHFISGLINLNYKTFFKLCFITLVAVAVVMIFFSLFSEIIFVLYDCKT